MLDRVLASGIPIVGCSIGPLGVFADATARWVAQLPQHDESGPAFQRLGRDVARDVVSSIVENF